MSRAKELKDIRKIVVKIGTSVITTDSGRLDQNRLKSIVEQVAWLVKKGYKCLLVTSGAIAAGVESLNLEKRPKTIPALQASAAVGQGLLVNNYAQLFLPHGIMVGQVLLTQHDTTHRHQYVNARNTLAKLLDYGAVPIINENDSTAVDEIKFGDNDTLAALVAGLIQADLLILCTDTDGLFTCDPKKDKEACLLSRVDEIDEETEKLASGAGTHFGSGGMVTKLNAAKIVTMGGTGMVIVNGQKDGIIKKVIKGEEVGTYFPPKKDTISGKKLWIAFGRISQGRVIVDDGAKRALISQGKSLLPAGVISCQGNFSVGDAVDISDGEGKIFAKGLTNYSFKELKKIKGLKTDKLKQILEGEVSQEVIHRDCLVVLK